MARVRMSPLSSNTPTTDTEPGQTSPPLPRQRRIRLASTGKAEPGHEETATLSQFAEMRGRVVRPWRSPSVRVASKVKVPMAPGYVNF